MSKLAKQFPSIPLILFAYKHILKSRAQSNSTLTTQISHFILLQYAAQLTHIPPPLRIARDSHLWTATSFRVSAATAITSSPLRTALCALTRPAPSHKFLKPSNSVLFLAAYSSFSGLSFLFVHSSRSLYFCFTSSLNFSFKALWTNTFEAIKLYLISTAQSTTSLQRETRLR